MGGQQGVNTIDMERTLKSLNGYHEVEVRSLSFLYYYLNNCNHIWTFNNPHQLLWSTSVEVDKAGFPALKEDFIPSAKLACCYIQALNSKDCQKTRSNSKDFQKRRFNHVELPADKIESLESTSTQQSLIPNLKWG